MPYRYNLTPARNGVCNVFIPNVLGPNENARQDAGLTCVAHFLHFLEYRGLGCSDRQACVDRVDLWSNGQVAQRECVPSHLGCFLELRVVFEIGRVPLCNQSCRQLRLLLTMAFEVEFQTGSTNPKIVGLKPKIYLTGKIALPPNTWTKL